MSADTISRAEYASIYVCVYLPHEVREREREGEREEDKPPRSEEIETVRADDLYARPMGLRSLLSEGEGEREMGI